MNILNQPPPTDLLTSEDAPRPAPPASGRARGRGVVPLLRARHGRAHSSSTADGLQTDPGDRVCRGGPLQLLLELVPPRRPRALEPRHHARPSAPAPLRPPGAGQA